MKPGAILASNTSTLDLDKIAAFTQRPQDVIGLHFFSPANVMKLLEIVRGEKTGKDVLATSGAVEEDQEDGVVSGVCDGFIGNRMIEQYSRQAGFLLDEGALPEQVDKAIEKFGFAMGPFRMGDLAGNDIGWYIRKRRYVETPDLDYSKTADLLCETGPLRPEDRRRLVRLQGGRPQAYPSQMVNDMIVAARPTSASSAARSRTRKSSSAWCMRWSMKARASWRKALPARFRHRHGLPDRLRLPGAPRRPDALRRHGRPAQCRDGDGEIRQRQSW
jgi:3-hydroxyacyl-CoA dehydrogenase